MSEQKPDILTERMSKLFMHIRRTTDHASNPLCYFSIGKELELDHDGLSPMLTELFRRSLLDRRLDRCDSCKHTTRRVYHYWPRRAPKRSGPEIQQLKPVADEAPAPAPPQHATNGSRLLSERSLEVLRNEYARTKERYPILIERALCIAFPEALNSAMEAKEIERKRLAEKVADAAKKFAEDNGLTVDALVAILAKR